MASSLLDIRDLTGNRGTGSQGFTLQIEALTLHQGEAVGIIGPSGCGKSTLLDLVGLVLRPQQAGCFRLGSHDIAALWQQDKQSALAAVRAQHIGYVLQTGGLLPFLSVRDNIRLSCDLLGLPRNSQHEQHLIKVLGLGRLLDNKPAALSIGERQRVAIARALAHKPRLILADEPTASLDPAHSVRVMELLLHIARALSVGILVVSHDWDLLSRFEVRPVQAQMAESGLTCFSDLAYRQGGQNG